MSLSLLSYKPTCQNQRVADFEVASEETPRIYDSEIAMGPDEKMELIQAAYRQVFHEQQMLESYCQTSLESQFRANQITTREFIRGLLLSDSFKRLNYDSNNNYRFVQLCIQRVLGREPFSDREKMAWSTVIATQGIKDFIDSLLNSEEYEQAFGGFIVPCQRRRILPVRSQGDLPFSRLTRYDSSDRPDLLTRLTQPESLTSPMEGAGQELFIAGLAVLILSALLLALGATSGL